ncbi:YARHG domain-containing protein [Flavobacterium zepuense]|uniref:YARHG domain-containing protein n=1 Tax=Flavobacterium zepuense TaxID=2593302 RepID=A0A552V413_9FLAO|nr:YARHG domain-containing protein [Flavobacterium zepuense]TRW25224.1 YARHG domain-containing protein [Flavobacterium zepuense]
MKQIVLSVFVLMLIVSCKEEKAETKKSSKGDLAYNEAEKETHKELYGIWTGNIYPEDENHEYTDDVAKKISIKINKITKDSVYGQSIVAGYQRLLVGKLTDNGTKTMFVLDEPGSNKYDGRFELTLQNDTLKGSWASYKKNPDTAPFKSLELVQKQFMYNPNFMLSDEIDLTDWSHPKQEEVNYTISEEGNAEEEVVEVMDVYRSASEDIFKFNASTQKLTEEELKNLQKLDLEIIRNTIFARHGYSFKKNSIRYFFEVNPWYVPVSNNVDKELTQLEKDNIVLLTRLEKYATDHYDSFGR